MLDVRRRGIDSFCHRPYPQLMTTMNISLPRQLKEHVDARVAEGGYGSSSDYIRDLIRKDQQCQAEQHFVALISEGLESGGPRLVDDEFWQEKKDRLARKIASK